MVKGADLAQRASQGLQVEVAQVCLPTSTRWKGEKWSVQRVNTCGSGEMTLEARECGVQGARACGQHAGSGELVSGLGSRPRASPGLPTGFGTDFTIVPILSV